MTRTTIAASDPAATLREIARTLRHLADLVERLDIDANPVAEIATRPTLIELEPEELDIGVDEAFAWEDEPATAEAAELDRLRAWLAERGITIVAEHRPHPADEALDWFADFIGSRYAHVEPLLDAFKRTQSSGRRFTLNLRDAPPETIAFTNQLAQKLEEVGFLFDYRYFRSPTRVLKARPSDNPLAINLLNGGWLERYVETSLRRLVAERAEHLPLAILRGTQVRLASGQDAEFDILASVDGAVVHVEAKTGDFAKYLARYTGFRRILGLPADRSILVVAGLSESTAARLRAVHGITVTGLDEFPRHLARAVDAALAAR